MADIWKVRQDASAEGLSSIPTRHRPLPFILCSESHQQYLKPSQTSEGRRQVQGWAPGLAENRSRCLEQGQKTKQPERLEIGAHGTPRVLVTLAGATGTLQTHPVSGKDQAHTVLPGLRAPGDRRKPGM